MKNEHLFRIGAKALGPYSGGAMKATTTTLSTLLAIAACSGAPAANGGFGPGGPLTSAATDASETSSTQSSSAESGGASSASTGEAPEPGSTGASTGAPVPDLGSRPDLGPWLPAGCDGKKIDFLFVISNCNTMEFAQDSLLAAFPAFMAAIEARNIDKHILVTTSLPMWVMSDCADCISDCDKQGTPPHCGAELTECDTMLGAARTFHGGKGASNRRCELVGGNRYITSEEVNVEAAFNCLATVGIDGDDAYSAGAMLAAISPELNAEGACNAGFLRRDALLVITIIADTGDSFSPNLPKDWVEEVLAAKGGDPDAVYALIITTDADIPGDLCYPDVPELPQGRLRTFAQAMPNASIESICADDFVPYFEDALGSILALCESFVPPE